MQRHLAHLAHLLLPLALAGCGAAGDSASEAPSGNVGFGGAQDIGQFRNILQEGGIPGPSTLDAGGFFAEHYVALPPADCGQPLCLQSMLSVGTDWTSSAYQNTLAVALNTPIDPATIQDEPLDLVVVVDTSGSMSVDDRIDYARDGLHLLVDTLQEDDRLALVTYNSTVDVRTDLATALDRPALHEMIAALEAGGSTNIYDGLQAGLELAFSSRDPERQSRVVLLSDGNATVGITDSESIITMAEEYIGTGIGLTTIGVGLDFNIELMRGLAERGAGNFYFLEDAAAIEEVFTKELDYFVSPLALDVTVEVRAAPAYALGDVLGTSLWKTEGGVGSMHLPAVFLASRQSTDPSDDGGSRGGGGTLLIPMLPSIMEAEDPNAVADVYVRYKMPDSEEIIEQAIEVRNPAEPGVATEDTYVSNEAMAKQYAMYNIYLGLREAATLADQGRYNCALATLDQIDAQAETWNLEHADGDIATDRELIGMFQSNLVAAGAQPTAEGAICDDTDYGYPDDYYYEDDVVVYGCSVAGRGGNGAGAALLVLAALALVTRRRGGQIRADLA